MQKYSEFPIEEFDPTKPLELKFKVLKEYLEDFEKLK
jgi:large subunit ribosomal protein L4